MSEKLNEAIGQLKLKLVRLFGQDGHPDLKDEVRALEEAVTETSEKKEEPAPAPVVESVEEEQEEPESESKSTKRKKK